jgi:hypothetical protein
MKKPYCDKEIGEAIREEHKQLAGHSSKGRSILASNPLHIET